MKLATPKPVTLKQFQKWVDDLKPLEFILAQMMDRSVTQKLDDHLMYLIAHGGGIMRDVRRN